MDILVIKNGSEFGSYSIPEISNFLQSGRLSPKDSVRLHGKEMLLSDVPELNEFVSNPYPDSDDTTDGSREPSPSSSAFADPSRGPVYKRIRGAIQEELEEFLKPFSPSSDEQLGIHSLRSNGFFLQFVNQANGFTDNCCQKLVKIIRSESVIPAVRASPTPNLSVRIRNTAFGKLDEILGRYASISKRIQVIDGNLKAIQEALRKGPEPSTSESTPAASPDASEEAEWATSDRMEREFALLAQAKVNGAERIKHYLQAMETVPAAAMEYGADKCFGADVDFELVNQETEEIRSCIHPALMRATASFARVLELEKKTVADHHTSVASTHELGYLTSVLDQMVEERVEKKIKAERRFKKNIILLLLLYVGGTAVFLLFFM